MKKESKVKVSIIIPSYNRTRGLINCLTTVFKQDFDDFEVIVVDDGSTERYCQMLWMRNSTHSPKSHYATTSSLNSSSTNFLFSSTSSISLFVL